MKIESVVKKKLIVEKSIFYIKKTFLYVNY